jgi:hypothetical protein
MRNELHAAALELISRAQFSLSAAESFASARWFIRCIPHLSGSFRRRRLAIKSVCWRRKLNQNCFLISCMTELGNNARPPCWMIARIIDARGRGRFIYSGERERLILKICTRRRSITDTMEIKSSEKAINAFLALVPPADKIEFWRAFLSSFSKFQQLLSIRKFQDFKSWSIHHSS